MIRTKTILSWIKDQRKIYRHKKSLLKQKNEANSQVVVVAIICTCVFVCLRNQLFFFFVVTTISPTRVLLNNHSIISVYYPNFGYMPFFLFSVFVFCLSLYIFDLEVKDKILQKVFRNAPICKPQKQTVTKDWTVLSYALKKCCAERDNSVAKCMSRPRHIVKT